MWSVERDPILRSSFITLTLLEGSPDLARFRRRMAHAVQALPRLHQRVRGGSPPQLRWPEWVDDESFDLDYHVRHVALPPPGSVEQLLELAAVEAQDNFDLARPLWTIWIVEGLEGDRSALLAKMHHTITDGVGGLRLSMQFIDLEPDAPDPAPVAQPDGTATAGSGEGRGLLDAPAEIAAAVRRATRTVGTAAGIAATGVTHPGEAVETARSLVRQAFITEAARSSIWAGKRGLARHFELLSFDLDRAKEAARALGGSVNDLYVAGVAGGAAAYHRSHGADIDELRMSMAISTRQDRSAGGNSFTPARVLVPAGIENPSDRFKQVRERLSITRSERSLNLTNALAGVLTTMPTPLLVRLARQQVETVDFATSNLRGAPFDLYVAGARILANHPFGPTGGTAFNATVLSYKGSMDVGINCDTVAVTDPVLLCRCIQEGIAETIDAGTTPKRPRRRAKQAKKAPTQPDSGTARTATRAATDPVAAAAATQVSTDPATPATPATPAAPADATRAADTGTGPNTETASKQTAASLSAEQTETTRPRL